MAGLSAWIVYVATAAPGLIWGDGIELAAVCASLGIAHPTGYPLFTLLGHLFTYLPVGEIPFRVTLFCATTMALAVVCMEQILARMLAGTGDRGWRRLASTAGALAFAWSLGPWNHATRTEVYGLQLVLQSALLLLAWDLLPKVSGEAVAGRRLQGKGSYLVSWILGLGFAHHLLTLALLPLWGACLWNHGRRVTGGRRHRRLLGHAVALLLGLLPIFYLPIRAAQMPEVSWGHPATLEGLWWTLSGGDFPSDLFFVEQRGSSFTATSFVSHLADRGRALTFYMVGNVMPLAGLPRTLHWFALVLGGLCLGRGVGLLWRRHRNFAWPWLAGLGLYGGVLFTYNIGDIVDYQLGFFSLLWPVSWWGAWNLVRPDLEPSSYEVSWWRRMGFRDHRLSQGGKGGRSARWAFGLALLLLPLALLVGNYGLADRSDDDLIDRFAERLLRDLPPRTILLTQGDFSTATAWYQQAVKGERPDVLVYCLDFFYDDWYGDMLARKDLGGRRLGTSETGGEWGEPFVEALDRLIVAANPDTPVLILPSPRQARALARRFHLIPQHSLLDADEIAAYELAGWRAPQPMLFRLRSRSVAGAPLSAQRP